MMYIHLRVKRELKEMFAERLMGPVTVVDVACKNGDVSIET